jgi:hypothetical protein
LVISITDENKQAFKTHTGEKFAIAAANFIMVQIFVKELKPETKLK